MAYVEQVLVPRLAKGDIVFMDNLRTHKIDGVAGLVYGNRGSPERLTLN